MRTLLDIENTSELARQKELENFEILDSFPEDEFDDIVELAANICNVPISLISLLDRDRQWFKAKVGLSAKETDRRFAFCNHAIKEPDKVMIVQNALKDSRFKDNPLVTGDPNIRFYAGAPIVTSNNFALGTLCVIDDKPRIFSEEETRLLRVLADKVMYMIDLRKENLAKERQLENSRNALEITLSRLLEAQRIAKIGSWDWFAKTNKFYWSPEMFNLFGISDEMTERDSNLITYSKWKSLIDPEDYPQVKSVVEDCLARKKSGQVEFRLNTRENTKTWLISKGNIDTDSDGNITRVHGTVQDITERKKAEANKEIYREALEELLFGLSHKIRQPVANLIGLINSLETTDLTPGRMKEYAMYFKVSASELDNFIREMTTFIHQNKVTIGAG